MVRCGCSGDDYFNAIHFHGGFSDSFHAFPFRTGGRFQHGDCYTDTGVRHIDCVVGCDIKLYF